MGEAEADLDSGRDCCGGCCSATSAAAGVVDMVEEGLADLVAGAAVDLGDLAVGVQVAAERAAVGKFDLPRRLKPISRMCFERSAEALRHPKTPPKKRVRGVEWFRKN